MQRWYRARINTSNTQYFIAPPLFSALGAARALLMDRQDRQRIVHHGIRHFAGLHIVELICMSSASAAACAWRLARPAVQAAVAVAVAVVVVVVVVVALPWDQRRAAAVAAAGRNLPSDPPAGSPAQLARRQAQPRPLALHAIDDRTYHT